MNTIARIAAVALLCISPITSAKDFKSGIVFGPFTLAPGQNIVAAAFNFDAKEILVKFSIRDVEGIVLAESKEATLAPFTGFEFEVPHSELTQTQDPMPFALDLSASPSGLLQDGSSTSSLQLVDGQTGQVELHRDARGFEGGAPNQSGLGPGQGTARFNPLRVTPDRLISLSGTFDEPPGDLLARIVDLEGTQLAEIPIKVGDRLGFTEIVDTTNIAGFPMEPTTAGILLARATADPADPLPESDERPNNAFGRISLELLDRDTQRAVTIQTQTVRLRRNKKKDDQTQDPL